MQPIWHEMSGSKSNAVKDPKMEDLKCIEVDLFDVNGTVGDLNKHSKKCKSTMETKEEGSLLAATDYSKMSVATSSKNDLKQDGSSSKVNSTPTQVPKSIAVPPNP